MVDRKLVLLNDMALHLKLEAVKPDDAARLVVAGSHLVRMTLAELALPGAEMIWTDFRHSASLGALHAAMQAAGGLDRRGGVFGHVRGADAAAIAAAPGSPEDRADLPAGEGCNLAGAVRGPYPATAGRSRGERFAGDAGSAGRPQPRLRAAISGALPKKWAATDVAAQVKERRQGRTASLGTEVSDSSRHEAARRGTGSGR